MEGTGFEFDANGMEDFKDTGANRGRQNSGRRDVDVDQTLDIAEGIGQQFFVLELMQFFCPGPLLSNLPVSQHDLRV